MQGFFAARREPFRRCAGAGGKRFLGSAGKDAAGVCCPAGAAEFLFYVKKM